MARYFSNTNVCGYTNVYLKITLDSFFVLGELKLYYNGV